MAAADNLVVIPDFTTAVAVDVTDRDGPSLMLGVVFERRGPGDASLSTGSESDSGHIRLRVRKESGIKEILGKLKTVVLLIR